MNTNVTLSIDADLLAKARKRAGEMGTTVNQLVRDQLATFVGEDDLDAVIAEFRRTSGQGNPDPDWKFNREEMYDERFSESNYGKS